MRMKNNKIVILFTMLMCMIGKQAFAFDAKIDGIYYEFYGTKAVVTYYSSSSNENAYSGNITIPESVSYNGTTYSVTSIGAEAFRFCSKLTSVTIPNSVTSIGSYAFYCCSSLTSVTIPNSVKSLGSKAFKNCSGKLTVNCNIPDANESDDSPFSYSTFSEVIIGNDVTSIGKFAFYNCIYLRTVTIGNSVTSIGEYAFSGCSLLASVIISDIAAWCNISFGSNPLSYAHHLYLNGEELKNLIIPNSVTSIPNSAFSDCSGLMGVTIPNSVTSIGESAFRGCSNLQSVVVGNGITHLPNYVFGTGKRLKSLTIGSGVLSISSRAFEVNNNSSYSPIKTIWLTNTPPSGYSKMAGTVNYVANDLYTSINNKTVYPFLSSLFEVDGMKYVPVSPSERTCDAIDCLYSEAATNINIGATVLYKGVQMNVMKVHKYACYGNDYIGTAELGCNGDVEEGAFYGCTSMTSATLGDNITSIGYSAFGSCSKLERIVIPNAVKVIGESAFYRCSAMETVKMGNGVQTINSSAFSGCSSLTDVQIGSNVETICEYAFSWCSSLPIIRIPRSVINIKGGVFSGCSGLKTVIMDDREKILNLGSNGSSPLFSSCPLDSVYIGGNISYNTSSSYGYSPFYRNTSLRTVVITDKETEISENEFYGCTNLQDVKIGDGVESFGDWAFSGCSSLKNFSFGMSVKTIGKEAFSDCTAMEHIYSRSPIPPVCGTQALDDINKWNCVLTVPAGNKAAYQAADQWKEFFFVEEGEAVNKFINVTIEQNEGGKVLVNGTETPGQIQKGSDVELQFIPDEGYSLKQVLVNGDDVTAEVTDGKYTVTGANEDLTIKVTFDYSYPSGILETLMSSQHSVRIYSPNGKKLNKLQKGLNVVVLEDGTIKKIMMK